MISEHISYKEGVYSNTAIRKGIDFEFPRMPDLKPQLKQIFEKNINKKYILSDNTWSWLQNHAKKQHSGQTGL